GGRIPFKDEGRHLFKTHGCSREESPIACHQLVVPVLAAAHQDGMEHAYFRNGTAQGRDAVETAQTPRLIGVLANAFDGYHYQFHACDPSMAARPHEACLHWLPCRRRLSFLKHFVVYCSKIRQWTHYMASRHGTRE